MQNGPLDGNAGHKDDPERPELKAHRIIESSEKEMLERYWKTKGFFGLAG